MADELQPLIHRLRTSSFEESYKALHELEQLGSVAVEPLCDILRDPNSQHVWWLVVESLGRMGDRRAVQPIIDVLKRPNEPDVFISLVRKHAAYALGDLRDVRAVDILIELLEEKAWAEDIEDSDVVFLSSEPEHETIEAAVGALSMIREWRGTQAVIERLLRGDTWCDCRMGEWGGEQAFQYLVAAVGSEDGKRRKHAISLLGEFGDVRAIPILAPFLELDEPDDVRSSAAYALSEFRSLKSLPKLIVALTDPNDRVQQHSAHGIMLLTMTSRHISHIDPDREAELHSAVEEVGEKKLVDILVHTVHHARLYVAAYAVLFLEFFLPYLSDSELKRRTQMTLEAQSDELRSSVQDTLKRHFPPSNPWNP